MLDLYSGQAVPVESVLPPSWAVDTPALGGTYRKEARNQQILLPAWIYELRSVNGHGLSAFPPQLVHALEPTCGGGLMIRRANRKNNPSPDARSGATLVEMAFVLPWFFVFVLAFIEFGHVFLTVHVLNGAAKQASRAGIADNSETQDVKDKADEILTSLLTPTSVFKVEVLDGSIFDDPNVDASSINYDALPEADLSHAESGQLFIVRCTVPYDDIAILGPKWLTGVTLSGLSVMRHE